jgi:guanylate kinase
MLEWAQVHGHYYGKSKAEFTEAARQKKIALVEIDVQGMRAVKKAYKDRVKTIFIVVPSWEELARRLRHRGTETEAQIATRLETARREAEYISEYDYKVTNDKLATALAELEKIILQK